MMTEYVLKRYAAYYRGWCQAFGEHESVPGEDTGISWLFGENQIGKSAPFISGLPSRQMNQLYLQ